MGTGHGTPEGGLEFAYEGVLDSYRAQNWERGVELVRV